MGTDVTFDFSDQVAVVTGASGGIGGAIVDVFSAAGADVVLHGRNEEALAKGVDVVERNGRRAVSVAGNVRNPDEAEVLIQTALDTFGRIDVLVNNAGGNFAARLEDLSTNAWNATMEANLSGAFFVAKAALPAFRRQGGGVVVNIGSASAGYAHPLRGAYAAAKAGLASLTRTMSWEWAQDHVRVNCIEPGAIVTPSSRFAASDLVAQVARNIALGRAGTPEEIATVCAFLASSAASFITGETIVVAGGPHTSTPADVDLLHQNPSSHTSDETARSGGTA